jgi:hypothetical protein
MKTLTRAFALILCLGASVTAQADDKELQQAINGAAQDLAENEWRKAQRELDKARGDFKDSQDTELRAQYGFYSALVNHQCADDAKVPQPERTEARTAAIAGYKEYLQSHPKSGGTLNNLAQLYAQDPAQQQWALELYDQAVGLQDSRSSAYELNRAKLQSEMGLNDAALKSSTEVLKKDRRNSAAQDLSLALLEKSGDIEGIARFIRGLAESGAVSTAIDTAVSEIDRLPGKREPVLVVLAETLANPTLQDMPGQFGATAAAKSLAKHAQATDIGGGVREMLALYEKPGDPQASYWWHQDFQYRDDQKGWFRGTTFTTLARALGDRCRRAGADNYPCAEAYYNFALEFSRPYIDTDAFLALAQIYGTTDRRDKLTAIEKRYEGELFSGKGDSISRGDLRKEYDFHLALGTMYSYLDKWTNSQWAPASAVFQLENAKRVSEQYNKRNPTKPQLEFPAESAGMLSTGYEKAGNFNLAAKVRVEAAKKASDSGDQYGARELIDPKWMSTLPTKGVDKAVVDQAVVLDRNLPKKKSKGT